MYLRSSAKRLQIADKSDMVNLICKFRVVDLKKLLSFVCELTSCTSKEELFQVCLEIYFNEKVKAKILEIYR